MPRPDYEKLKKIWDIYADTEHYSYCRTDKYKNYHDGGASIRDNFTTYINKHSEDEDICHGLAIEIMPIDACANGGFARIRQLINAFLYNLYNVQRLPDNKGKVIRYLAKILYVLIPFNALRYLVWKHAESIMAKESWDNCEEVTELVGSIKGMLIKHPKEDFDEVVFKNFEGRYLPVMKGYKRYLNLIWGDYLKLPPENERVAKHNVVYLNLQESYLNFKGKYYLNHKRS